MGGPRHTRKKDNRPHGLDIVHALTEPGCWGAERTPNDTRIVWATLHWTAHTEDVTT
jgi:hypothetical protein